MIDTTQRLLYQLCDINPKDFWDFTQAETAQMIEEKIKAHDQKNKNYSMLFADLKATLYNASLGPHMKKGTKFPYKYKDFLPKNFKHDKEEISEAEKTRRWMAAGDAMMKVVEEHERETGVKT